MKVGDSSYLNSVMKKELRDAAETKDQKKLKEQCENFESIFVKMMLDEMDKTVDRKGSLIYGGNAEDIFKGMLNDERAKDMAKNHSMGIADMLYKQLSKQLPKGEEK